MPDSPKTGPQRPNQRIRASSLKTEKAQVKDGIVFSSGTASWQTYRNGAEKIATQHIEIRQEADLLQVSTLTLGLSAAEGGYHWSGELRLWDNEILMGWYAANDRAVRAKGTMYFVLHPHGLSMSGRWVGLGYDDNIMTGWASIEQTPEQAQETIARLTQRAE